MAKTTLRRTEDAVIGTVADLIRGDRLRINGHVVGQPEMSVLTRLGIATPVGVAEKDPTKPGPAAKIYSIPTTGTFAALRR